MRSDSSDRLRSVISVNMAKEPRKQPSLSISDVADTRHQTAVPSGRRNARSAWYRLGTPNKLGAALERLRHWGRIEIEPAAPAEHVILVVAIVLSGDPSAARPPIEVRRVDSENELFAIECVASKETTRILLGRRSPSGRLIRGEHAWTLPETVESDAPLPLR